MSAYQRTKGLRFERELCRRLRDLYGSGVKRTIQSRGGSKDGPDVDGTPWFIEAKVGAAPSPRRALLQAEAAAEERQDPRPCIAVCKWDSEGGGKAPDELVTMRWSTFMQLLTGELP